MTSSVLAAPESASASRLSASRAIVLLLAVVCYWFMAQAGFLFRQESTNVAAIWPVAGFALAILLLVPQSIFWLALGAMTATNLAANLYIGNSVWLSVAFMTANAAEMLIVSYLARARGAPGAFVDDVATLARVFFVPLLLGVSTAATIGAWATTRQTGAPFFEEFGTWFLADVVGILVVTPLLVFWVQAIWQRSLLPNHTEAAVFVLTLAAMAFWFWGWQLLEPLGLRRPYVLYPILFCCALYCPPHLTASLMAALAGVGLYNIIHGRPSYINPLATDQMQVLRSSQAFVWVLSASVLLVIAIVRSKQRAEQRLRRAHALSERAVQQRTVELQRANDLLQSEIAAKQRVAEKLYENESHARSELNELETISRTASVGLCLIDQDLRYVRINELLAEIGGYSPEEHLGRTIYDVHPELPPHLERMLRHVIATGEELRDVEVEGPLRTTDGTPRKFLVHYYPVDTERGRSVGCIVSEVTEKLEMEAELQRQRNELAHAARVNLLGGLAAGLAHELNQPLHAIANYAQGCLRRIQQGSSGSEQIEGVLSTINSEAHRAAEIVRRLRDLVKKQPPRFEPINLHSAVQRTLRLLRPELKSNHIQVSVEVPANLPHPQGDAIQIEQVLLNLLLNAFEATRGNPPEQRNIVVTAHVEEGAVWLAVHDNGRGMPPDHLDKLFDPFYSTRDDGLGMGLAISRDIIERHGGRLTAAANSPVGAIFTIALPLPQ